jgi:hypothetical protein
MYDDTSWGLCYNLKSDGVVDKHKLVMTLLLGQNKNDPTLKALPKPSAKKTKGNLDQGYVFPEPGGNHPFPTFSPRKCAQLPYPPHTWFLSSQDWRRNLFLFFF